MSEEKKKGGFWASLFGRNKKQEEQKIEPIIEASSVESVDVSPTGRHVAPDPGRTVRGLRREGPPARGYDGGQ